jgi:hypothetical protein
MSNLINHRSAVMSLVAASLMSIFLVQTTRAQATSQPADFSGTWKWTIQGRDGTPRDTTMKLKQDGDKVSGTVTGRQGDSEVKDGVIKDGELTFKIVRTFNDQEITVNYSGKLDGDTIKGKIANSFNGQANSRDWEAKRDTGMATTKPAM